MLFEKKRRLQTEVTVLVDFIADYWRTSSPTPQLAESADEPVPLAAARSTVSSPAFSALSVAA